MPERENVRAFVIQTKKGVNMAYKLSAEIQILLDEYRALREEMESHEAALSRLQSRQYAIKGEIAALEIPPLKAEMEANNEKIAHLEERKRYYETDLKIREAQKKELLRKQRNRRIFTRGGMLEASALRTGYLRFCTRLPPSYRTQQAVQASAGNRRSFPIFRAAGTIPSSASPSCCTPRLSRPTPVI